MISAYASLILLLLSLGLEAQISVPEISEELKNNANEVTIFDNSVFTIKNIRDSELERHYRVAVLNKYARFGNTISLHYDSFRNVDFAKVIVYDQHGKRVESYSLKDLEDWKSSASEIASDNRTKYLGISGYNYPYYVDVHYKVSYNGSLSFPEWMPVVSDNHSVLRATMRVVGPSSRLFRYLGVNVADPEVRSTAKEYSVTWEIDDFAAFEYEYFSYRDTDYVPIVYVAPNEFSMQGYEGNMSTWAGFGQWIELLNRGRNDLSKEDLLELEGIVNDLPDQESRVRAIYKYMQENTRYVSIQLGIGGWQPFKAGFVHDKKYGDCKALSYYTKSLLEHFNIDSYYTLIRAGYDAFPLNSEFPSSAFNHVILTVPVNQDTIWLECTSQKNPFGYLGAFTNDRQGLLINGDKSHLIKTSAYTHQDNIRSTKVKMTLNEDGSGSGNIRRKYQCLELLDDDFNYIISIPEVDQKQWMYDELDWNTFSVEEFNVDSITNDPIPKSGFSLQLRMDKLARVTGKRLFLSPFQFSNANNFEIPDEVRSTPIEIRFPFTHIDTISIDLPSGMIPEKTIGNTSVHTRFGDYDIVVIQSDSQIRVIRTFSLFKGRYPAAEYPEFRQFIQSVKKTDRQRMVLVYE